MRPDSATLESNNPPTFAWNAIPNISSCKLEVSTGSSFQSLVIDQPDRPNSAHTPAGPLPDTTYYWRVRAKDSRGTTGPWSRSWSFTLATAGPPAPALLSPDDSSVTHDNTPGFSWTASPGAASYHLQVSTDKDLATIKLDLPGLADAAYTAGTPLADGTYYWRVRARSSAGDWGNWSRLRSFAIITAGLEAPRLKYPGAGSVISDTMPTFLWRTVSRAATYRLQVSTVADFTSLVFAPPDSATLSYTSTVPLPDQTYFWRVAALNQQGYLGNWSSTWSFTIETVAPAAPVLVSPKNGIATNDTTPEFVWRAVSDAVRYWLQVSDSTDFADMAVEIAKVISTRYTLRAALKDGTYYWKVRSVDFVGNRGD